MKSQIELRKQNSELYGVFCNGISIGTIKMSRNRFHNRNLYLNLDLDSYDKKNSRDLFALLQQEHNVPFQIMCDSTEKELIGFIEAAGFVCKRKCYECEVTRVDLKATNEKEEGLQVILTYSQYPKKEYLAAGRILYHQYAKKHAEINPLTVSLEEFLGILPKEVYVELKEEKIKNFAFIEENEIAYVGSVSKETYVSFITQMVTRLFEEHEAICFEYDDIDWEAMQLEELFTMDGDESYNTYILERTTK